MRQQERLGRTAARPNMAGDPHARMNAMLESRAPYYAQADVTLDTDGRSIDDVLRQALEAIEERTRRNLVPKLSIDSPIERSDLYVSRGVRRAMPELSQKAMAKSLAALDC